MTRAVRPRDRRANPHLLAHRRAVDAFDNLRIAAAVRCRRSSRFTASHAVSSWFDPVVVDVLTRLVPPFMVGTIVRLSDEQNRGCAEPHRASVPADRARTTVRFQRAHGQGSALDLRLHRQPFIAAVDDNDVTPYLFDLRASLTAYAMSDSITGPRRTGDPRREVAVAQPSIRGPPVPRSCREHERARSLGCERPATRCDTFRRRAAPD